LLLVFALIALLRGHNHPGGGFIGGLLAGLAIVFKGFAYTPGQAWRAMKVSPAGHMALGLGMILLSLLPGVLMDRPLMTGIWLAVPVPLLGEIKLGTPFLFDAGIFLAVTGITLLFLFSLKKEV
jgi:multicomponent Na+:H+ antiporter subunit B